MEKVTKELRTFFRIDQAVRHGLLHEHEERTYEPVYSYSRRKEIG